MSAIIRVLGPTELRDRAEAISAWLERNGIDPNRVAMTWLSIERDDAHRPSLRYQEQRHTVDGKRHIDPTALLQGHQQAWTKERVAPLTEPLPADFGEPYSMWAGNWTLKGNEGNTT